MSLLFRTASEDGSSESCDQGGAGLLYSIIITCHNQQEYIRNAVDSVLSQNHDSTEVIVVDDGSRDASAEILNLYASQVTLIFLPVARGAIEARNRGAAAAKGNYLIFLDGDDLLAPWALQVHDQIIAEWRPGTIVSGARWFEGPVPQFAPADLPENLELVQYESMIDRDRASGWYTGGFVVKRQDFFRAGGWTPHIFHLDLLDLAAKLRASGRSVLVCAPYTMLYRMHDSNSIRNVSACIEAAHELMEREREGFYPAGQRPRIERLAWYAGIIVCLAKRGMRAGVFKDSFRLLISGWSVILAAIVQGSIRRFRGRRPIEIRALEHKQPAILARATR